MEFLTKNWKVLAALVGLSVMHMVWQRCKIIDLRDKVVLITGGSRGFGLAMAEEFAQAGAKLVLCSRDAQELARARAQLSALTGDVLTLPCDVIDQEQVQHAVAQATAYFGRIDVLINNAGIISAGPWRSLTREDFETSMNVMFWGAFNMIMAVLPQMVARKNGRIVNISSIGGKVSVPHLLPYASAKFALIGLSEGLHAELARDGIAVVTVAPGLMRTGSHINAFFKGDTNQTEYTLFTLLDTLPITSISARRAARQVVSATRRGTTELIITLPAQLMARLYGMFPGLGSDLLGLVNHLLPDGKGAGTARYSGRESETSITQSFLTLLGRRASQDYNQHPEVSS